MPIGASSFNEAAALLPRKAGTAPFASPDRRHRFNEAAALLPRKAHVRMPPVVGDYPRFNEAAALLPRKAPMSCESIHARSCFNEAAALLPRKACEMGLVLMLSNSASMRPRHCCRGRQFPFEIEEDLPDQLQ